MAKKLIETIGQANPDLLREIEALAGDGATADRIAKHLFTKGVDVSRGAVVSWLNDRVGATR